MVWSTLGCTSTYSLPVASLQSAVKLPNPIVTSRDVGDVVISTARHARGDAGGGTSGDAEGGAEGDTEGDTEDGVTGTEGDADGDAAGGPSSGCSSASSPATPLPQWTGRLGIGI